LGCRGLALLVGGYLWYMVDGGGGGCWVGRLDGGRGRSEVGVR